jgi:septal ring factor EnvC (AmiA/AmiB activator)
MIGNKNKKENIMNWFENKTTQLIALAGIVTTLAGFGYTGATYVNRIDNLEAQIGGIGDTELAQKAIEERFAAIETSVKFLEKEIDSVEVPDVTEIKTDIATIKADIQSLEKSIDKLETGNPLAG